MEQTEAAKRCTVTQRKPRTRCLASKLICEKSYDLLRPKPISNIDIATIDRLSSRSVTNLTGDTDNLNTINTCIGDGNVGDLAVDKKNRIEQDSIKPLSVFKSVAIESPRNEADVNSDDSTSSKLTMYGLNPEAKEWTQTLENSGYSKHQTTQCDVLLQIRETERRLQCQQQTIARLKDKVEEAEHKEEEWKRQLKVRENELRTLKQEKRRLGETIGRLLKQFNDVLRS